MFEGRLTGEVDAHERDDAKLGLLMTGSGKMEG
jgi:hypothetical protein